MNSKTNTVLIPHDGSTLSGSVVESGISFINPETSVILVHIDTHEQGGDIPAINDTTEFLRAKGFKVSRHDVRAKDAVKGLIKAIEEISPELVLMATHGQSGSGRFIRGNVAERMLQSCPVPLLMIDPMVNQQVTLRSVLVPIDASEESFKVIEPLLDIATDAGPEITLLFVDFDDPTDTEEIRNKRRESRKADVSTWFNKIEHQLAAAGLSTKIRIEHGNAAEKILDTVQEDDYDMIAMTTHGRSGLSRWAFGSVAEKVLGVCSKPILLFRIK